MSYIYILTGAIIIQCLPSVHLKLLRISYSYIGLECLGPLSQALLAGCGREVRPQMTDRAAVITIKHQSLGISVGQSAGPIVALIIL